MALSNLQRELWANTLVALFNENAWMNRLINTNVVGDTMGDVFHIIGAGDVAVEDVDDDADLSYDELTDTNVSLTPNFDKAFKFIHKDTDKTGTNLNAIPTYVARGAERLIDAWDASILADHASTGSNFDNGGTDWQFTKDTAAEIPVFMAKLEKAVVDLNWPDASEKYIVAPSGFKEAILTYTGGRASDLGDSVLTQGLNNAFTYGGFNVFISNNCTTVSTTLHGLCGLVGNGIAGITQVNPNSIETLRAEGRFADLYRGRMRGGHKVYKTDAVVDIEFNSTVVATS